MAKQIPALIKDIYDDLGYSNVMHAIGEVGEKAGYKYTHPDGEPMPMRKFQQMIAYVGRRGRVKSTAALFHIANIMLAPVNGVVVDREILGAISDGLPLRAIVQPKEVVEICQHCEEPVRYLPVCKCHWKKN